MPMPTLGNTHNNYDRDDSDIEDDDDGLGFYRGVTFALPISLALWGMIFIVARGIARGLGII